MTLNPLVHIDPIGTLLLPLLGIPFGWAKPVPVNPMRFRRSVPMRTGMMITAAAGPVSNVLIAIVCVLVLGLAFRWQPQWVTSAQLGVGTLLNTAIGMNVMLALFNLLPIPPLDGSRVVDGLIPDRWRSYWEMYARYAGIALLGAVFLGQYVLAVPFAYAQQMLMKLLEVVAGVS